MLPMFATPSRHILSAGLGKNVLWDRWQCGAGKVFNEWLISTKWLILCFFSISSSVRRIDKFSCQASTNVGHKFIMCDHTSNIFRRKINFYFQFPLPSVSLALETTKLDLWNEFDCKKLSWNVNQTFDNADVAQIFWERCQWEFADWMPVGLGTSCLINGCDVRRS